MSATAFACHMSCTTVNVTKAITGGAVASTKAVTPRPTYSSEAPTLHAAVRRIPRCTSRDVPGPRQHIRRNPTAWIARDIAETAR